MPLETILKYPVVFIGSFCIAFLLVPVVKRLAYVVGAVDQPGERRLNKAAVPRLGGLALFAGFHFGCALVFLPHWLPFSGELDSTWWLNFLLISSGLLLIGIVDDIHQLRPITKLLGQILVATLLYYANFRFGRVLGIQLPVALDYVVTTFWYLALINAFNLIDGLDGLAAGLACVGATGIAGAMLILRQPGDALVLVALIGACLAVLRFNFHPAKIFLGDSGSMFLGLTIATIAVSTSTKGTTLAVIGISALAAGVPLLDTLLAIWRRSVRKIALDNKDAINSASVMGADMDHLHHRLLRLGLGQDAVAMRLWSFSAVIVACGLAIMTFSSQAAGIFLLAFVSATYVIVRHLAHVELWDSGRALVQGLKRPTKPVLAAILYPIVDFILLAVAFYISAFIVFEETKTFSLKGYWIEHVAQWSCLSFIALVLSNSYRRVWSRARTADFVFLGLSILSSVVVSLGVQLILSPIDRVQLTKLAVTYMFVSVSLVVGWRSIPRIIKEVMASRFANKLNRRGDNGRRVLVYGAGERCGLFLRQLGYASIIRRNRHTVVGLIDDARNLRRRIVYGFTVLGDLTDLPTLIDSNAIDEIIISCTLPEEKQAFLTRVAADRGVEVSSWNLNTNGAPVAASDQRRAVS
ncbi:MAG: hypothetical protein KDD66_17140 [Bdellovibrionales bacterium]|nr:hypothetical protein [Bdellovibrionales bacterium]